MKQIVPVHLCCFRSFIGWIITAETARGLFFTGIGADREEAISAFRTAFPHLSEAAGRVETEPHLPAGSAAALIKAYLESGPRLRQVWQELAVLPLDLEPTPFQKRVWQRMRQLVPGETISYGRLARECGSPGAARAVGAACAANPVAIVIPCHRVIRSAGGLGGFGWGLERKQALLDWERRFC